MKVLVYSQRYGNTTFIDRQVEQIAEVHEVCYLCNYPFQGDAPVPVKVIQFSYPTLFLKLRDRLEMSHLWLTFYNPRFARELKVYLEAFKPEIIHLQFGYEALRFLDNFTESTPVIIHFRGYDASSMLVNKAYVRAISFYLRKSNIWAVSVCVHLLENLNHSGVKFYNPPTVIYSNTDVQTFKRSEKLPPPKDVFRLIQVSSFREKKGHKYTLEAVSRYMQISGDSNIELIFVGCVAGPPYEEVATLAASLNLDNVVQFVGQKTVSQVQDLLQSSHCAVLHSVTAENGDQEGIPYALMEAMAMELPIITTRHAGIPELVANNTFAILVEERDVKAYAKAIASVISQWRLAPENRMCIERQFSKNTFMTNMLALYDYIRKQGDCSSKDIEGI